MGHVYAPSCAASASDLCLDTSTSRIRPLRDLSGSRMGCSSTLFRGLLNGLVAIF
jgi:hypothetical protein